MSARGQHPFSLIGEAEEVADGVAFVTSFENVTAFRTDDGLVLVDTGSVPLAQHVHATLRRWESSPLHTAVGHIDDVFGVPVFEEEAASNGWTAPRVVAPEALPARFDRYILTAGYNEIVNQRQFQLPDLRWPREYRYPDETYRDALTLDIGGTELRSCVRTHGGGDQAPQSAAPYRARHGPAHRAPADAPALAPPAAEGGRGTRLLHAPGLCGFATARI